MANSERPNRQSVRWRSFNYAGPGTVFLTICTAKQAHLFGSVVGEAMELSPFGEIAAHEWQRSSSMRPALVDHGWIIMPNHMHALVTFVVENDETHGHSGARQRARNSISSIVSGYKGATTSRIRQLTGEPLMDVWQRGFHDVVIRTEKMFDASAKYIVENPVRWREDRYKDPEK